jgi:hypothetical protein
VDGKRMVDAGKRQAAPSIDPSLGDRPPGKTGSRHIIALT